MDPTTTTARRRRRRRTVLLFSSRRAMNLSPKPLSLSLVPTGKRVSFLQVYLLNLGLLRAISFVLSCYRMSSSRRLPPPSSVLSSRELWHIGYCGKWEKLRRAINPRLVRFHSLSLSRSRSGSPQIIPIRTNQDLRF